MGQPVLTFLQKLAREIPEAPECRLALALHLVILGRIEEAIAIDAALPSDLPLATAYRIEFARAYFNRGDKHFQQNDFEKALPDLDRAIQYDPQYSEAYDHRGYVYLQKGDFDRAIADYDPRSASVRRTPVSVIRIAPRHISARGISTKRTPIWRKSSRLRRMTPRSGISTP